MRLRISTASLLYLAVLLVPHAVSATTVTLIVEPSPGTPYNFSINGSSNYVGLSCLNDQRLVNTGESWTASATNLETLISNATIANPSNPKSVSVDGVLTIGNLEADAYLFSLYTFDVTSFTNSEIQDAMWSVLDGYYVYDDLTTSGQQMDVQNDVAAALSANEASSFYSEFTFYAPTVWGTPNDNDLHGSIPQEFLGRSMVTPEPSSLILLGTGILGLARRLRHRIAVSKQSA